MAKFHKYLVSHINAANTRDATVVVPEQAINELQINTEGYGFSSVFDNSTAFTTYPVETTVLSEAIGKAFAKVAPDAVDSLDVFRVAAALLKLDASVASEVISKDLDKQIGDSELEYTEGDNYFLDTAYTGNEHYATARDIFSSELELLKLEATDISEAVSIALSSPYTELKALSDSVSIVNTFQRVFEELITLSEDFKTMQNYYMPQSVAIQEGISSFLSKALLDSSDVSDVVGIALDRPLSESSTTSESFVKLFDKTSVEPLTGTESFSVAYLLPELDNTTMSEAVTLGLASEKVETPTHLEVIAKTMTTEIREFDFVDSTYLDGDFGISANTVYSLDILAASVMPAYSDVSTTFDNLTHRLDKLIAEYQYTTDSMVFDVAPAAVDNVSSSSESIRFSSAINLSNDTFTKVELLYLGLDKPLSDVSDVSDTGLIIVQDYMSDYVSLSDLNPYLSKSTTTF